MALVYRHIKPDGTTFYIGIGVTKKRAYSKHGRNRYWKNTVNKYGYEVQILTQNISYEDAKEYEKILISYYGRKDLSLGNLVNLTDGGEGSKNINEIERVKKRQRLIEYNKIKDYSFTQSNEYKNKMRLSCLGKNSKKILDTQTNKIFNSLKEASEFYKINYSVLSEMINNKRKNKTNLIWEN